MKNLIKTATICLYVILLFSICIVHADTESSDLHNAFGYVDGDHYRNPFLGIEIRWPEAEYKLPPSSSIDDIIANFEDSSDGMVLMMLNDTNDEGLSLKLYRQTIELSGRKAYWIPIRYNYWEEQLHTINIQISIGDYNVLIIANSYQPLSPEDVFSKISFFEQ